MDKLPAAKALVERGFAVFPIKPEAKSPPLLQDWPTRAAKTVEEVELFWSAMPDANIGVTAKGLLVVDIDTRRDGFVSLQTLEPLPPTLTSKTPSGGEHRFFRLPDGHPGVGNSGDKLGPGLDVKSGNGYVVGPGSDVDPEVDPAVQVAGRYHFVDPTVPIAEAPGWLLDRLGSSGVRQRDATPPSAIPPAPPESVAQARSWLASRPVGGGSSYTSACYLRDLGLSLDQAREVFAEHDPRPDALDQVDHAYRYAQGAPGAKAVAADDFPVVSPAAETPTLSEVTAPYRGLLRLDQLAAASTKSDYLVKGLLQRASYAVAYGAPGEGKTFVALDIAYHVAAGKPWHGHPVKGGSVLYLAYEGMGGMVKRAQALRKQYGEEQVPFYLADATFNLRELAGRAALGEVVRSLPEKPALIVIDTFAHALRGGDENSAQDVGAFSTAVLELIKATGACVLLIHHTGKNKSAGARGSSALNAALDTEIEIDGKEITATKQRDVELGNPIGFRLVPVALGIDEDGDIETSCVVEQAEVVGKERIELRGNQQLAFDALCRMSEDNKPVSAEAWKRKCAEFLGKPPGKRFYEIRVALLDKGLIVVDDVGMVTRRME